VLALQGKGLGGNYFEIKVSYLERTQRLLERVHKAILSSNLEVLNESLKSVEEIQVKIDKLDRENLMVRPSLSKDEIDRIKALLTNILQASQDNEHLLRKEKENVLSELKVTRLKRNARNVYGGLGPNALPIRSVG
jgi:hypothetical protein